MRIRLEYILAMGQRRAEHGFDVADCVTSGRRVGYRPGRHCQTRLHGIYVSTSSGDWRESESYSYSNASSDADANANPYTDEHAKPGARLHGAEFHGHQVEPGAIYLERRRVYPA
jgi:hypothetical protein